MEVKELIYVYQNKREYEAVRLSQGLQKTAETDKLQTCRKDKQMTQNKTGIKQMADLSGEETKEQ